QLVSELTHSNSAAQFTARTSLLGAHSSAWARRSAGVGALAASRVQRMQLERPRAALAHRIQSECRAPREAVLPLGLQWVELGCVHVADESLQTHAAEDAAAANRLQRLLDGEQ